MINVHSNRLYWSGPDPAVVCGGRRSIEAAVDLAPVFAALFNQVLGTIYSYGQLIVLKVVQKECSHHVDSVMVAVVQDRVPVLFSGGLGPVYLIAHEELVLAEYIPAEVLWQIT